MGKGVLKVLLGRETSDATRSLNPFLGKLFAFLSLNIFTQYALVNYIVPTLWFSRFYMLFYLSYIFLTSVIKFVQYLF